MIHTIKKIKTISIIPALFALTACGALDRIANIGKAPELSPIQNMQIAPQIATPDPQLLAYSQKLKRQANAVSNNGSLWKAGTRHFFKDQRANSIGDILTVNIVINDEAKINNKTTRTRSNTDKANIGKLFGLETKLGESVTPTDLINFGSATKNEGSGKVDRKEAIKLKLAAVVVGKLPNGNLVIRGRQEVRVNFEVRELTIMGVIRPEDISSINVIEHTQIAEARISYGGRGQLTDVQQARYGSQLFDVLFPF